MTAAETDPPMLLEVKELTKRFGGVVANDAVSLTVEQGECVGLIGPNGSGKTTLINVLAGAFRPDAGAIVYRGRSIAGLRPHRIAEYGIARTFQNFRLFGAMTTRDNVVAGALLRTKGMMACNEASDEILSWVGLAAKADDLADSLSTGQRKRLELARCLATQPRLLVLDEPLAGVDPGNRKPIVELVARLRDELGLTVLLVEHDPNVIRHLCNRVVVLDQGRVLSEGTPHDVYSDPAVREAYLAPQHA